MGECMKWPERYDTWIIALAGAVFFLPFLGGVHLFDWDEVNFAECAREMIETGQYFRVQINYEPFWEKPPLFFWLQALSMKIWGVNEYAARFPNAVAGIIGLVALYRFGRQWKDRLFGWLWAGAYFGAILPHLYFKSGIIDPWFNLFIFLGFYYFIRFQQCSQDAVRRRWTYLLLGGGMIGLGILTKGPVAALLPGLSILIYWAYRRFRAGFHFGHLILYGVAALLLTGFWFGLEILSNGSWFVEEFIRYQIRLLSTEDAGHGGFPAYHFVVLLFGCFPISIFALDTIFRKKENTAFGQASVWWIILLVVVLIIFSIVQSKIIHYSSLAYYPLAFLAAQSFYRLLKSGISIPKWIPAGLVISGLPVSLLTIATPYYGKRPELLAPLFEKDPFASANLEAEVYWSGWESLAGVWLLLIAGISIFLLIRRRYQRAIPLLLIGTAIYVQLALVFFVKRVEGYSQRAAIEFFESLEGVDAYVQTIGYKSYAHLFYTRKKPGGHPDQTQIHWLRKGAIDKDVYFVTKIHKPKGLDKLEDVEEIGRKNGFVFWVRRH
jgi:4-amino-4-deoxy-L-arabinose transferase-like glycosyltransferase